MNWTGIITFLAVITGIYFLWSWLSKKEANPTTQEAFDSHPALITDPITGKQHAPAGGVVGDPYFEAPISGDILTTDPQESLTYETIYNIVVEAPEIPALNTGDIMDDIVEDIEEITKQPIPASTGSGSPAPRTYVTHVSPTGGKTYATAEAMQEKTVKPIYDPVKMVSDTVRPIGSFGGR